MGYLFRGRLAVGFEAKRCRLGEGEALGISQSASLFRDISPYVRSRIYGDSRSLAFLHQIDRHDVRRVGNTRQSHRKVTRVDSGSTPASLRLSAFLIHSANINSAAAVSGKPLSGACVRLNELQFGTRWPEGYGCITKPKLLSKSGTVLLTLVSFPLIKLNMAAPTASVPFSVNGKTAIVTGAGSGKDDTTEVHDMISHE